MPPSNLNLLQSSDRLSCLGPLGEQNVSLDRVRGEMETIPFTAGMTDLLKFISEQENTHCIVISDSNTIFIDWILNASGLRAAVDHVFTNRATITESGYMEVQHYHCHDCECCPVNLCKRKVLELYLADQFKRNVEYQQIFYVGDGGNDLCPTTSLRRCDVVMPRKGYTLEKLLSRQESQQDNVSLRAKVVAWSTGTEILEELKKSL